MTILHLEKNLNTIHIFYLKINIPIASVMELCERKIGDAHNAMLFTFKPNEASRSHVSTIYFLQYTTLWFKIDLAQMDNLKIDLISI